MKKINQKKTQEKIWEDQWGEYDKSVFESLSSRFTKEAYKEIKRFMDINDKLILEAGCGTGRFCLLLANEFPSSKITGIDISDSALRIASNAKLQLQIKNVEFGKEDLFFTDYENDYFDVVFNEGVIEHFSLEEKLTYKEALREMVRITKPQGKVIIAVPNWYCFPHTFYKWFLSLIGKEFKYGYERSFKHKELVNLFKEFNLCNIELSAWYPSHGFYRLEEYSRMFYLAGKLVDLIQIKSFIRKFGFEIIIKGMKSQ